MSEKTVITQEEKVLAGLSHGSILLGIFTNGIGGIVVALVIWLTQKQKSAYVAAQALQALVYQVVITVLTWVVCRVGDVCGWPSCCRRFLSTPPLTRRPRRPGCGLVWA